MEAENQLAIPVCPTATCALAGSHGRPVSGRSDAVCVTAQPEPVHEKAAERLGGSRGALLRVGSLLCWRTTGPPSSGRPDLARSVGAEATAEDSFMFDFRTSF